MKKTQGYKQGYCEIPVVMVEDDCPLQPITIPCWSLAALLDVLESKLYFEEEDEEYQLNIEKDNVQ